MPINRIITDIEMATIKPKTVELPDFADDVGE
jgi:hypothetical protein